MGGRVKTNTIVDRMLCEEFKSRVASEDCLRSLSRRIDEAVEEEAAVKLLLGHWGI